MLIAIVIAATAAVSVAAGFFLCSLLSAASRADDCARCLREE